MYICIDVSVVGATTIIDAVRSIVQLCMRTYDVIDMYL